MSLSLAHNEDEDEQHEEQVSIATGVFSSSSNGNNNEIVQVMNTTNLICHNKEWVGNFIPKCVKIKGKNLDKLCSSANKCEQMCFLRNHTGHEQCTCFKGFRMVNDECVGKLILQNLQKEKWRITIFVIDINECTETRNNCEHQCINTIGSYTCRCMPGFAYDGPHKCKGERV